MYRPSRRSLKTASASPSPSPSATSTSTTPSPSWKEALRRECIERARRRRTERVSRARAGAATAGGGGANGHAANGDGIPQRREPARRDGEARRVVEEGLRALGGNVGVVPSSSSPASASASAVTRSTPPEDDGFLFRGGHFAFGTTPSPPAAAVGVGVSGAPFVFGSSGANSNASATPQQQQQWQLPNLRGQSYQTPPCHSNQVALPPRHDASHYYINEEELFELMREVEDELQREEAMLIQEIHEVERQRQREELYVQEQIAHYEEFVECDRATGGAADDGDATMAQEEEEVAPQHAVPGVGRHVGVAGDATVPCPVCRGANLIQTRANVIVCPNSQQQLQRQSPCNLRLDLNGEGLTLDHLRRTLSDAYVEHSASCPSGELRFAVRDEFGVTTLRAACSTCHADVVVL